MIQLKLRINERANVTGRKYFTDPSGNYLYYTDAKGFELATHDWNYDGDVYSIYGMPVYEIRNGYEFISKDDFDLKQISEDEFRSRLHDRLDEYFAEGTDKEGNYYYLDSTLGGKIHYDNRNFMALGKVIYGTPDDREMTIQKEIDFLVRDRVE